jgi:hypothetical protein
VNSSKISHKWKLDLERQPIICEITNQSDKNDKEKTHDICLPSSVQQWPTMGESSSPFHLNQTSDFTIRSQLGYKD